MSYQYREWIKRYLARNNGFVRGKCKEACEAMKKEFRELRMAAGFVHYVHGREEHWWLVDLAGNVVDPTVSQFASPVDYEELDLTDPKTRELVPSGRCMDCGSDVYGGKSFCDSNCHDRFMRSLL